MSLLCSSTPSPSGPLVSKIARRQVLSFLYPREIRISNQLQANRSRRYSQVTATKSDALGDWFISSLASAGNCSHHPKHSSSIGGSSTPRPPKLECHSRQIADSRNRRLKHTRAGLHGAAWSLRSHSVDVQRKYNTQDVKLAKPTLRDTEERRTRTPKWEFLDLVDHYDGQLHVDQDSSEEASQFFRSNREPILFREADTEDDMQSFEHPWPADMATKRKLLSLDLALLDSDKDPSDIFELYRDLPGPRVPYLTAESRHRLLHRLAVVHRKDEQSMLRYLSVVDDLKTAAIPLNTSEWTSALSFVSKYVHKSTEIEVEAALHMWREMEHVAGVKGNHATFNVLFDVACKAGKFALAEMIYKEMESRGHEFNRYHHVSLISYYGLKRNGDGARQAYKELVEAGEMVDTVVLNAMISALLNAQEPDAAENTYQRMKNKCLEGVEFEKRSQPKDFKARRLITASLRKLAMKAKKKPEMREKYQQQVSIVPDSQTYRLLVYYFAIQAGDLVKVAELLHDMRMFQIPTQGWVYLALFKGFTIHGGVLHTSWTKEHLERVFSAFIKSTEENTEDLYISKWMVVWIIRAFTKCSEKARTLEVWEKLQEKWAPTAGDMDFAMSTLRPLLEEDNFDIAKLLAPHEVMQV